MPKVKSWGLSDNSEPEDLESFEPYDGPDPKKGVYKFRLTNFRVKANKNDDPMLNGLLIVTEDRPDKKQYNGFAIWFNQNVTDQGKPYVKQMLNAVGVTWNDLMNNTIVEGTWPESSGDDPAPIAKIGRVKFSANDVMLRASIGLRRNQEDGEMEVKTFLPWKDDDEIDAATDDGGSDEVEPDEVEPDDVGEVVAEEEAWTREALEELSIVSDDPEVYGLAEILDEAGTEYDADREDEEYYICLILEEEPPADPRVAKRTPAKKTAAKKTVAKKTAAKGGAPF